MKYIKLISVVIGLITMAGCKNFTEKSISKSPTAVEAFNPAVEGKSLNGTRLVSVRNTQGLSQKLSNFSLDADNWIREYSASSSYRKSEVSLETVGALKARGLFKQTFYSDDSQVAVVTAHGDFTKSEGLGKGIHYTKFIFMYDPNSGSPLAMSLMP